MITNPKIERKKLEISKTESNITEYKNKLQKQKQELTVLENEEIVALYRSEIFNEDILATLRQSKNQTESGGEPQRKEEKQNAFFDN